MLAIQQPGQHASWPTVWSTEAEFDLQQRLNKLPFYAPTGFGDTMTDIQSLLSKGSQIITQAGPYLDTVLMVLQDPALPQLMTRVKTLKAIDTAKSGPTAPTTPGAAPAAKPGIGLSRVLPLLDGAIWYVKYPWAPWAIGGGALVVLGGLGFGIGRWTKKKCKTAGLGRKYRRRQP